jgi:hypothetical protein
LVENWLTLEKGGYNEVKTGPEITFRTRVSEEIIRENIPDLSLEEKVLVQMQTMDIPKERAGQYLAEGGGEFKMLEAEKKKTERQVNGSPIKATTKTEQPT